MRSYVSWKMKPEQSIQNTKEMYNSAHRKKWTSGEGNIFEESKCEIKEMWRRFQVSGLRRLPLWTHSQSLSGKKDVAPTHHTNHLIFPGRLQLMLCKTKLGVQFCSSSGQSPTKVVYHPATKVGMNLWLMYAQMCGQGGRIKLIPGLVTNRHIKQRMSPPPKTVFVFPF
jgi:hypothetical protein